jgi:hypothetical protein
MSIEVLHLHSQMASMLTCIINMTPRDHDRLRQTAYVADNILDVVCDANGVTRITRIEKVKARWQTAQLYKVILTIGNPFTDHFENTSFPFSLRLFYYIAYHDA